jgi:hypothetical protein
MLLGFNTPLVLDNRRRGTWLWLVVHLCHRYHPWFWTFRWTRRHRPRMLIHTPEPLVKEIQRILDELQPDPNRFHDRAYRKEILRKALAIIREIKGVEREPW